ncbi:DUF86 domain-containing protein (plasmid) [Synechocystis sp. B12]|nr:DUF86 domain-containing protein [Synechocystis sp. B12]
MDALIFARRIVAFTTNMTEENFFTDIKIQDAVMRNIAVLREALRRISPEFRQTYSKIPYNQGNYLKLQDELFTGETIKSLGRNFLEFEANKSQETVP